MGKPDTTGTVDIADSVGYVVGRKGHFVAQTAEIDIHPNMRRRIPAEAVKKENNVERRAIALACVFHLVGDIHQPLHTAQLFTTDYPEGDRGENEICVRVAQAGQPMDLHRFWDGVITSSQNLTMSIAISVAVLIAGTSIAAAVTRCDGQLHSGTYDTVLVPKGKTCALVDGGTHIVEQNVILQEGASLISIEPGFTINGNLLGYGV